jgi:hypothetical protein
MATVDPNRNTQRNTMTVWDRLTLLEQDMKLVQAALPPIPVNPVVPPPVVVTPPIVEPAPVPKAEADALRIIFGPNVR